MIVISYENRMVSLKIPVNEFLRHCKITKACKFIVDNHYKKDNFGYFRLTLYEFFYFSKSVN